MNCNLDLLPYSTLIAIAFGFLEVQIQKVAGTAIIKVISTIVYATGLPLITQRNSSKDINTPKTCEKISLVII